MTVQYTSFLKFDKPDAGEAAWDVNLRSFADLSDEAIAGVALLSMAAGDQTPVIVDGTTSPARHAVIIATGAPGVVRTLNLPAIEKSWIIDNSMTGGFSLRSCARATSTITTNATSSNCP